MNLGVLPVDQSSRLYKDYCWEGKHALFGYPADRFPEFRWIGSLEQRFAWLATNAVIKKTASKYLIREMIEWGGSQNGTLQKFDDGSGEINLFETIQTVLKNLENPTDAIRSALQLPGMGLTYASKLLRFLCPSRYGALDNRIRTALFDAGLLPKIHDSNQTNMVNGYLSFLRMLNELEAILETRRIEKPRCRLGANSWSPAALEMALFRWAELGGKMRK